MADTYGLYETNHDLWGSEDYQEQNLDGIDESNRYRFLLDENGDNITVGQSSIQSAHYGTVLILDRIFQKIVALIESMQRLTATQADRLNFLSDWQKAYTDLGNQVPVFTQGSGAFGENSDDGGNPYRDDANRVASTYTEEIRSTRTIVENDSRALQTDVNNNNDAVEQQSNTATSILQQFSTILSAIYK